MNQSTDISTCCNYPVRVEGDTSPLGGTCYYVCTKCEKPCNTIGKVNATDTVRGNDWIYQVSPHVPESSPEGSYTSDELSLPGGRTLTEYIAEVKQESFNEGVKALGERVKRIPTFKEKSYSQKILNGVVDAIVLELTTPTEGRV